MSEEDDRRLGELAIQAGLLGPRELARAMREHRTSGKPLAETLIGLKLLTPEQAHALGGGAKVEKAAATAAAVPPPMRPTSRPRRVMRVMWRRMSPLGRVWFMVLVLLIVILAISIPLTLLWPAAPPPSVPPR